MILPAIHWVKGHYTFVPTENNVNNVTGRMYTLFRHRESKNRIPSVI